MILKNPINTKIAIRILESVIVVTVSRILFYNPVCMSEEIIAFVISILVKEFEHKTKAVTICNLIVATFGLVFSIIICLLF